MTTSPAQTPVTVVSSMDMVLRESAVAGTLCDIPDAVVVRHDIDARSGHVRRVVYDRSGTLEDVNVLLDHACPTCAVRDDLIPTVSRLAATLAPRVIVLALPVTADPGTVVPALVPLTDISVQGVVAVFNGATLSRDLLGDDLLAERGLAIADEDRRSVGEALVHQIEYADVLLSLNPLNDESAALLDHLADENAVRIVLHSPDARLVLDHHRAAGACARGDLRLVAPTGAPARSGVWTLDLQSWLPMHPARLQQNITRLGLGPLRGRGHFWLPTRQRVICGWDGAGGQLSIGNVGTWDGPPRTRLVVTGSGCDPANLESAFYKALVTYPELKRELTHWEGRDDGLDDWLGVREGVA